ncbi:MAG TPA: hypothetical protein VJQ84_04895 [Solirubrobacterales bacterium]|nr:hypothetical protein [Solirubrobacterales bacterium]
MPELEKPDYLGADPRLRVRYSRDNPNARVAGMLLGALLPMALLVALALLASGVVNRAGAGVVIVIALALFGYGYVGVRRRRAVRRLGAPPPTPKS